jgi:hypothetical protein
MPEMAIRAMVMVTKAMATGTPTIPNTDMKTVTTADLMKEGKTTAEITEGEMMTEEIMTEKGKEGTNYYNSSIIYEYKDPINNGVFKNAQRKMG